MPIDKEYLNYFETNTLISLFCMLVVVAGLQKTNVFNLISDKLVFRFKTTRGVIYALIFGTFFFDMIVANDMSLITFLPLTYIVLHSTNNDKYLPITYILQTIAANMGGMITPYGNPQNLYLYSYFNIPLVEFITILFKQSFVVFVLLVIAGLFIKKTPLKLKEENKLDVDKNKLKVYAVLFVTTILSIFRVIPTVVNLFVLLAVVCAADVKVLKKVDYSLLLTFCAFFVLSGNIARITAIQELITNIIKKDVLIAGIVSCQFISNVPTAVLLSKFTTNYKELLVAVNVGSLGILISSLASLITLKEYMKHQKGKFLKYLLKYTLINSMFLIILYIVTKII